MAARRWTGRLAVALLVAGVLYLPIRRELLDYGWIRAASFRGADGSRLVFWDTGRYGLGSTVGNYRIERFPEVPWISCIRLDSGVRLYVKWQDRVYRVEDIPDLTGAGYRYVRD